MASMSLPLPKASPESWAPLQGLSLPLGEPFFGPPVAPSGENPLPLEAPRGSGNVSLGWVSRQTPSSGVGAPTEDFDVTSMPSPNERVSGYLCNKVRSDKRQRKRAFAHRGHWGRQRRLQLKHERLRLAFAYQGVDLLKLKSLRWGEVAKGPWGSARGG
ncbi:hypothetical protein cyc_00066 [Cyclospora cayetanensis]|nr:hypothetical protein cyc_00066 [Cyclospora cayetanensis]